MFWDKGYTPSQNIEALLEKENATVEEFLDDDDVLQECKTLKKAIAKYFTRPEVIKRLVEIITTEPSDELPLAQRFRHANMACEILTLGLPSLDEKILADSETLKILYSYLENEPPLNPLLSSFFYKTFCMLFTKKPEQDWFLYQQMCLQLLEYLKSRGNFLDLIFKHFSTPVIPELILQLLKDVEGGQLKRNLYEWLTEEKLVDRLIAILGKPDECDKHSNVTEFLCDLIKQGRTMRQTEHENDSFEPAFDGSNPILKTIESEATIEALLNVILEPNAQESAIVSGISVVLTLIKPNTLVDETYSERSKFIQNREKEISEQIVTTVIRVMAPRLNELNQLLKSPPPMPPINTTAAKLAPPFGNTRLQVCRVFSVLLQTKNEEINKAICATDFFETMLDLFKEYCWNNFLHSEFEKCMQIIFESSAFNNNNNSAQGSTIANDGSNSKSSINGDTNGAVSMNLFDCITGGSLGGNACGTEKICEIKPIEIDDNMDDKKAAGENNGDGMEDDKLDIDQAAEAIEIESPALSATSPIEEISNERIATETVAMIDNSNAELKTTDVDAKEIDEHDATAAGETKSNNEECSFKEKESLKNPTDIGPSALQRHLIVNCKLITKLIDCWQHNQATETAERGRRLGYMGHLIKTLKHIINCISESEHIGALIENNLSDEAEREKWQTITNTKDGDLTKALALQNRLLANCNAHEACDFGHLAKELICENSTWKYIMSSNAFTNLGSHFAETMERHFGANIELDEEDEDDELAGAVGYNGSGNNGIGNSNCGGPSGGVGSLDFTNKLAIFGKMTKSIHLPSLGDGDGNGPPAAGTPGMCTNPWYDVDPFANLNPNSSSTSMGPWSSDYDHDNFADFETHFSSFTSDLGECLGGPQAGEKHKLGDDVEDENTSVGNDFAINERSDNQMANVDGDAVVGKSAADEYDNNANVERTTTGNGGGEGKGADALATTQTSTSPPTDKTDLVTGVVGTHNYVGDGIGVPHLLVRSLQSVMHESEDDYEDDEGMWTKPLGSSVNAAVNDDDDEAFAIENVENEKNSKTFTSELKAATDKDEFGALVQENNTVLINGTSTEVNAEDQSVESLKLATAAKNPAKDNSVNDHGDRDDDDNVDMNDIMATDVKKAKTAIEMERTTPPPTPAATY